MPRGAQLRLDLTWEREYGVSRSVSLDLGEGQELVGASGGGELSIAAKGTVKLDSSAADRRGDAQALANTRVDEGFSGVDFNVAVAADDAYFGASIGPVSLDLAPRTTRAGSPRASVSTSPARRVRPPPRSETSSRRPSR